MVVELCPRCRQPYTRDLYNSDVIHECNSGNPTLDQEDVLVVGNWEDYQGSGTINKSVQQTAGTINKLQGTAAFYDDCARV